MKFTRKLSTGSKPIEDQVQWKTVPVELKDKAGTTIFSMPEVEAPAHWSDTAVQILATKYFRKAGVPDNRYLIKEVEDGIPSWLARSRVSYAEQQDAPSGETSARQVFRRLAGAWTYHGWKMGLFWTTENLDYPEQKYKIDEKSAQIFYDELYLILARQLAAPNSPQWFNTGLWWAYGIEGPANGQWAINYDSMKGMVGVPFETSNSYEYPQPHACFIQPVDDDLVNPGGIMDLWTREARLFKYGSGTGSNFSSLRAEGEPLSGGGKSSGLMSFLEIGDRAAGAIKSGGTTRRAAKMVIVDADHPDIEKFIDWKAREEVKAAAMWIGSKLLADPQWNYFLSENGLMPSAMLDRKMAGMSFEEFGIDYEGEAIRTISGQNANNTVRVTDNFMQKVEEDGHWYSRNRVDGTVFRHKNAKDLWGKICRAAWASADPGLQFHDTINRWHTCKADGEIRASNPCSEYMFLDNTACNLASLNLGKFYNLTNLADPISYKFDVDLFCHVVELMTIVLDISVTMASFPSREIAQGSYNYRTLGLGYANLGGLLMRMGLPYDSDEGRQVAAATTALMHGQAYDTSSKLAQELGAFPRYEANQDSMREVLQLHHDAVSDIAYCEENEKILQAALEIWAGLHNMTFRNAQVTLLAPTGTIGLLMDCDTLGIEPDFSLRKYKSLAGGGAITLTNEAVDQALLKLGYKTHFRNLIKAYINDHGTVENCRDLDVNHWAVFDCAVAPEGFTRAIAPMGHVKMCAAVQPFLSGAISKTINMPNFATIDDVNEVYMESWKFGLKAVALYRHGSKLAQPLETKKREIPAQLVETADTVEKTWRVVTEFGETWGPPKELPRGVREYLPWRRTDAYTQKVKIGPEGQSIHITVGKYPDGRPGEIRLELSRVGTTLDAMANMVAMMISIGLQYGVPVEEFVERLESRKFEPSGLVEGHDQIKWASSIADLIARELGLTFLGRAEMGQVPTESYPNPVDTSGYGWQRTTMEYPKPVKAMRDICPSCHESCLIRSGTCQTCTNCGFNDGCGG